MGTTTSVRQFSRDPWDAEGRGADQRQEAAGDENMKWIASNGILLTNFYACKLTIRAVISSYC